MTGEARYSVVTDGLLGPAVAFPGTGLSSAMSVACPGSSSCVVVGNEETNGFAAVVSGSKVKTLKTIGEYAYRVACPTPSNCVIVGSKSLSATPTYLSFDPVTGAVGAPASPRPPARCPGSPAPRRRRASLLAPVRSGESG